MDTLRKRLLKRGTESLEQIDWRLNRALSEIDAAYESNIYKMEDFIVNDDFEVALNQLISRINVLYNFK